MKHLHAIVSYVILLTGLGTSLYLFLNGKQKEASTVLTATIMVCWFVA